MLKVFFSLCLSLLLSVPALAADRQFETVTINVPEGWIAQEQGSMVLLIAPGNSSAVTVITGPSQGLDARAIADTASKSAGGSAVKDEGGGVYSFSYQSGNQKAVMLVHTEGQTGIICTLVGDHPQLMDVARSIRLK